MQKLNDQSIYHYDKQEGFTEYNPMEFKYNGYTIDKLYQLYLHTKEKLEKLEEEAKLVKGWAVSEGVNIKSLYDITNHHLLTQFDEVKLIEKDKFGYALSVRNLASNEVLVKGWMEVPDDVENGVYRLVRGKLEKDEIKEEALWNIL